MRFMKQIRTRKENCMKIALVEDNGLHQAQIRQEIQNYFDELNEVCELHVFDNGSDMLDHYYSVGGYDLLLLDIQLPGMDGISVARQVRQKDDKVLIAFITSMTAYAVQGYSVCAMDYILKPINRISFRSTLDRARELFRQRTELSPQGTGCLRWIFHKFIILKRKDMPSDCIIQKAPSISMIP